MSLFKNLIAAEKLLFLNVVVFMLLYVPPDGSSEKRTWPMMVIRWKLAIMILIFLEENLPSSSASLWFI